MIKILDRIIPFVDHEFVLRSLVLNTGCTRQGFIFLYILLGECLDMTIKVINTVSQ